VPDVPVSPKLPLNVAIAFAAGLLLAVALALLFEHFDQSIKGDEDLTANTGLIPIGHIGITPPLRAGRTELPALLSNSAFGEAYRTVRTNLLFTTLERKAQVIVVTSALPGEGKSRTAANLAVVLAQAGHRTLLLDGDFRRPAQNRIFGRARSNGLSTLMLSDRLDQEAIAQVPAIQNLWLITSGPQPPNPSELLGSMRMREILGQLKLAFNYILVDTPPVGAVTDAAVLAASADAVLLVVEQGRTTHKAVNHAKETVERSGAKVLGVVFNKCRGAFTPYPYDYLYGVSQKGGSQGLSLTTAPEVATVHPIAPTGARPLVEDLSKLAHSEAETGTTRR
jgi:receptor protein-tyrosine kinase